MSARAQTIVWIAQRASAGVLAVCVVVHLAGIILAVQGGLSAAEILDRTRGQYGWLAFYGVFVVAVTVHATIGLRTICAEWLAWRGRSCDVALGIYGVVILVMGLRAALSVFAG